MKNELLYLWLIIFLSIFGLGFCGALRKSTINNEPAPLHNTEQLVYNEHDGKTSQTTYTSLITKEDNVAIKKDHNATLLENPNITGSNIFKNERRVKKQNNHKKNMEIFQQYRPTELNKELNTTEFCQKRRDIYNTYNYFYAFRSNKEAQVAFVSGKKNSVKSFNCSLTINTAQENALRILIKILMKNQFNFNYYANGIICRQTFTNKLCKEYKKEDFFNYHEIRMIKNHIIDLNSLNECNLRIINSIFALIHNHGRLRDKCCIQNKAEEKTILKYLYEILVDILWKIDDFNKKNITFIAAKCKLKDITCITTETHKALKTYQTKLKQKLNGTESLACELAMETENESEPSIVATTENELKPLIVSTTENESEGLAVSTTEKESETYNVPTTNYEYQSHEPIET